MWGPQLKIQFSVRSVKGNLSYWITRKNNKLFSYSLQ